MIRPSLIERAFQLARNGACADVVQIEKLLRKEGLYELGALDGTMLRRQLRDACDEARGKPVRPRAAARPIRKTRLRALI